MKGRSKSPAKRHTRVARCRIRCGRCEWSYGGKRVAKSEILKLAKYNAAKLEKIRDRAILRYRAAKASKRSKSPAKRKLSAKKGRSASPKRRKVKKSTKRRKPSGYIRFISAYHRCYKNRAVSASQLAKKWARLPLKLKEKFNAAKSYDEACRIYKRYLRVRYRKKPTTKRISKKKKTTKKSKSVRKSKSPKRKSAPKKKSPPKKKATKGRSKSPSKRKTSPKRK